jgi:hypothetical protein
MQAEYMLSVKVLSFIMNPIRTARMGRAGSVLSATFLVRLFIAICRKTKLSEYIDRQW